MPKKHCRGYIEQIEQQRDCQQSPGACYSHPQERSQRGPAIDAQAAHADSNRRTFDHKTSGWILVAEAGEKIAYEQRNQWVAGGQ